MERAFYNWCFNTNSYGMVRMETIIIVIIFLFIGVLSIIGIQKLGDKMASEEVAKRNIQEAENARADANKKHKAEADRKHKAEAGRKHKVAVAEEEHLALKLANLKSHLPFDPSTKTLSTELVLHDNNMWNDVTQLIKHQDNQKTSLYFVKIRSLMDDREYFKIGITTKNVKTMFKKSTEIELLEEVKIFDTEKWKAAFLEYHFLREFRLYDGLSTSIGEQRPKVRFSGYTEVVRSNSVNKISEYFEELDVYNRIYLR